MLPILWSSSTIDFVYRYEDLNQWTRDGIRLDIVSNIFFPNNSFLFLSAPWY